jgi:outer membrane lipoprotein-sorting protein
MTHRFRSRPRDTPRPARAAFVPLLAVLALLAVPGRARGEALPEARPLLSKLEAAVAPLFDLETDFVQLRHIALTDESVEARGRMRFKTPDFFRLDYREPDADVLTMRGDSLLVYFPAMNQAQRHTIDREDATRNLFLLFASRKGELASRFDVSLGPAGPEGPTLRLQPLADAIDYPITEILVRLAPNGLPRELFFREEGGDTVLFRLEKPRTNRKLVERDFVFVPPAGTEIIDR